MIAKQPTVYIRASKRNGTLSIEAQNPDWKDLWDDI